MQRALRVICLVVLSAYMVGCSGDSVNDTSSAPSPETAKAAAAKMPRPEMPSQKK